ncbi:hypothetical protein HWD32_gp35 [Gordonia phage Secretariat]|uniref:Uncharacterized protein n=1 Tax=Gordonia phage Secretariat TaxID=2725616 RepID=A0A6M3SXF3_9CAUD|nr:hypothetical protein HWD32_gp35 [Gordonia phage Secretariat]QJD49612.1 hypothetical protein SEA_SECRETARIAT_35 [Gordonia phage Secretariat]
MFTKKHSSNKVGIEKAIDELLAEMHEQDKDSEHYAGMVAQLTKLADVKETNNKVETGRSVDLNTLTIVAGNLIGILTIVIHERDHVMTSKAMTLLMKLR